MKQGLHSFSSNRTGFGKEVLCFSGVCGGYSFNGLEGTGEGRLLSTGEWHLLLSRVKVGIGYTYAYHKSTKFNLF